jgi:hypothetical protein
VPTRDDLLFRRFPNIPMMRKAARSKLPRFAFDQDRGRRWP